MNEKIRQHQQSSTPYIIKFRLRKIKATATIRQTQSQALLEALSPVLHVFVVGLIHLCEVHPPAEDAADAAEPLAELAALLGSAHAHTIPNWTASG